jgi:hypothetical protein
MATTTTLVMVMVMVMVMVIAMIIILLAKYDMKFEFNIFRMGSKKCGDLPNIMDVHV